MRKSADAATSRQGGIRVINQRVSNGLIAAVEVLYKSLGSFSALIRHGPETNDLRNWHADCITAAGNSGR